MAEVKITTDLFIRYLLGSDKNRPLLRSFINAVLEDSGYPPVCDVKVKNPYNLSEHQLLKETILDVKATDNKGRIYDIEVQVHDDSHYTNRSLYYWAKNYVDQLPVAGLYDTLQPVICINILNFTLIEAIDDIHSCFIIREQNHSELALSDHFQLHFIEINKFENSTQSIQKGLFEWLVYLKYGADKGEFMKYAITDDNILKAREEYDHFVADPVQKEMYDAHMKWVNDYNSGIHDSLQKGRAEGLAEGEAKAKLETARNMKKLGASVEFIIQATGLSEAEVLGL